MKTLRDCKVGETATVVKLHGTSALKRRVMDMGITKGTELYIRKVAPLGDPIEITVLARAFLMLARWILMTREISCILRWLNLRKS